MPTQEFYVRGVNDTEARGPFTMEQLITLGESGQIDTETLYYDAATEQWAIIGSNVELKASVFPQRKKLTVKPKEHVPGLNVVKEDQRAITVEGMLAAAEGKTEETKDRRRFAQTQLVCARIGMYAAMLALLASAVALVLPSIEIVVALDYGKMFGQPLLLVGLVDVVCGLLLALGMTAIYPFVRFRAMLGVGFLGALFWLQDQPMVGLAVAAGSIGIYLCTVFLNYTPIIISALLALVGMGGFAYHMLT
jgi:hypothetical protein